MIFTENASMFGFTDFTVICAAQEAEHGKRLLTLTH